MTSRKIKQKMETGRDQIQFLHERKRQTIQNIKDLEKTKTWTPVQTNSVKGWLADVAANAKTARGQLKTLNILYEGLEKRGKAAGPGWKEMAAKAVSEAAKPLKKAAELSKAFDADEEKCKKICKDHGVTA